MKTDFGSMMGIKLIAWEKTFWAHARNYSFMTKFLGDTPNSIIQRISTLKKDDKGSRAVITLIADLEGDGIVGDRQLEGNEEAMKSYEQVIQLDMLRHAQRNTGRRADQETIINFRTEAREKLSYWMADRQDQLAFLTLGGISYSYNTDGSLRTTSELPMLDFAAYVKPPSPKRITRWDNTAKRLMTYATGSNTTSAVTSADTPGWYMFVQLKAYCKNHYIKGVSESGGKETYHAFLTPDAMAKLKQDPDYNLALRHSVQAKNNEALFSGDAVHIDGIYLHEFRYVPNTAGATAGNKYGITGGVDGTQILFCGSQALAFAEIGSPVWDEKEFDYSNQIGIAAGCMVGFLRPQFTNRYEKNTVEDFGVVSCYVAT